MVFLRASIRVWNRLMSLLPARRRNPRALCSELIQIRFRDQRGRRIRETAVLEDLSERGARLSIALPLTAGSQVTFRAPGFETGACVSYCELADSGYAVGLEFAEDFRWDETLWVPEHMLKIPSREQPD